MSEALLTSELAARRQAKPRELGAVACAGCPFAELGCPKQGTGDDCPPPGELEKVQDVVASLEDDSIKSVWATDGGYVALPRKELKLQSLHIDIPQRVASQPKPKNTQTKNAEVKKIPKANKKGKLMGEFAAALLLPTKKAT